MNGRFLDGMHRIICFNELDSDFGYYGGEIIVADYIDKAQAKSYIRHKNKEMFNLGLPIHYYIQDINELEPDLEYWH